MGIADDIELALEAAIAMDEPFTVRGLAITGRDVMACGVPEGPAVGRALEAALEAVVDGTVSNEAGELRAFLAKWAARKRFREDRKRYLTNRGPIGNILIRARI